MYRTTMVVVVLRLCLELRKAELLTQVRIALFDVTGFATQTFSFSNYEGETTARIFRDDTLIESRTVVESDLKIHYIWRRRIRTYPRIYWFWSNILQRNRWRICRRRIPAFQADLALSGFAGKRTFNPPDITTHLRITGDAAPTAAFVESFTVKLATDGTARERFVPSYVGDGAMLLAYWWRASPEDTCLPGRHVVLVAGQKTTVMNNSSDLYSHSVDLLLQNSSHLQRNVKYRLTLVAV